MVSLFSTWRLVVGLVVAVLGGALASVGYGREPALFAVDGPGASSRFRSIAFSPKSDALVVSCVGKLSIWKTRANAGENRLIKRMKVPDSVHGGYHDDPIAVSSDGNHVAVLVGGKGTNIRSQFSVQVWDIKRGVAIGTYTDGDRYQAHSCFTFVPNSTDMYIAVQRSLDAWSATTGKHRKIAGADSYEGLGVQHMRVINDGSLVTSRADGRICLWDTKKGALKAFRNVRCSIYRVPGGGEIRTHYIVTSPDAKQAAAIDYVKTPVLIGDTLHTDSTAGYKLTLWDIEKGKSIRDLPLGAGKRDATSIAWSNDGKLLAWVSYDVNDDVGRTIECVVWDIDRGKQLMREKPPTGIVIGGVIAFSPDRKLLAMPAGDGTKKAMVAIWDISDLTKDEESRAESKQKDAAM